MTATVVYNNGRGAIASDEGKFTSLSDGFLNLKVIIIILIINNNNNNIFISGSVK